MIVLTDKKGHDLSVYPGSIDASEYGISKREHLFIEMLKSAPPIPGWWNSFYVKDKINEHYPDLSPQEVVTLQVAIIRQAGGLTKDGKKVLGKISNDNKEWVDILEKGREWMKEGQKHHYFQWRIYYATEMVKAVEGIENG